MIRKILFTVTLQVAFSFLMHAQYFTLKFAGGYAWPGIQNNEQIMGPKIDPFSPEKDGLLPMTNISDTLPLYEHVHGSYGNGGNFTFGFGYMINPYVGVEMGVSVLKSQTFRSSQTRGLTQRVIEGPPPVYQALGYYFMQANISTHALGLSLMPSIIIQAAKPGWKVYPYGRLGISLPVFGELEHKISIDVDTIVLDLIKNEPYFLGKHVDVTLKTEGTVSIGVNGALGIAYRPLPCLMISAEMNGQYLVTRAKSSRVTQWDTDGKDRIADRGVYRTEFNFVDKLDKNSNNADYNPNYDKNKPKDDLRPTGPFSNIGFNVGVTILLSKEILAKKKKGEQKK